LLRLVAARILIVEDDDSIRSAFVRALRREGENADELTDGEGVAEVIRRGSYRVVVLATRLPAVTGYEVLADLRGDERIPPIVVLSSSAQDVNQLAGDRNVILAINKTFALEHLDPVAAALAAVARSPR
jgi:DNA-binding response OmpR family regulator